jgi:hypothetical protein
VAHATHRGWITSVIVPALVVALITLTALCYASPPDPTWIAGLYDNADRDEIVLEVLAIDAVPAAAAAPPWSTAPAAAEPLWVAGRSVPNAPSLTALLDRSPPLA